MTLPDEQSVEQVLADLADPARAAHSAVFFKTGPGEYGEGDQFLGIRVPQLRQCIPRFRHLSLQDVGEFLQSPWHEQRLLAALLLVDRFRCCDVQEQEAIYFLYLDQIGKGINNWDIIDTTCPHIMGAWLFRRDRSILYQLAQSPNLWKRRGAMMACFYFIRQNDFDDAIRLAECLLDDSEDLIHKASGWMLREIGKRNQKVEEDFLVKFCPIMPRTMLRYAIERFDPEQRKKYMHAGK